MRDEELSSLLRSPALSLDPSPDLVASVRQGARRARRRRATGVAALSAVALGVAGLLGPSLLAGGEAPRERVAVSTADPRFPRATSAVATLAELNGGEVVTFFAGASWCTASVRASFNESCVGFLGNRVGPFAYSTVPGQASVRVDRDYLVAGVLGTAVAEVVVVLSDGTELPARTTSPEGFPRPVWWVQVPSGARAEGATAYDAAGQQVATADLS